MSLVTGPRILGATALLLLINSQLPVRHGGKLGAVLRPVADTVALPLREPVFRIARRLNRPDATPGDGLTDPATATRAQLAEGYERLLVELGQLRQHNDELIEKLKLIQRLPDDDDGTGLKLPRRTPRICAVTAFTDTGTRQVISINGGQNRGIAPGQTVRYGVDLVGRVVEPVGPVSADVELVTGQDIGFHVELTAPPDVANANLSAPLPGLEHLRVTPDPATGTFTAEIRHDTNPPIGADARLADQVHYRDARAHILGRVVEVRPYPQDPELLKQVVIRPRLDLRFLSEVAVLVPEQP